MKRALTWTLLVLVLLVVGLVSTVLLRAEPSGLPAPDPATVIHLPDGSGLPLADLLDRVCRGIPLDLTPSPEPLVPRAADDQTASIQAPSAAAARIDGLFTPEQLAAIERALAAESPIFHLAELARHEDRLDEAAALYLSVPENDPRYGRSRRRLAWDVLTKGQGQPQRAVAYAHDALAAEPFDANSWQDLARVYGATLGLDTDDWD